MDKVTFSFDIINKNIIKIEDKNFKINNVKRELYIQDPEWNKQFINKHILNKSFININNTFTTQAKNKIKHEVINTIKCFHNKSYKECTDNNCKAAINFITTNADRPCCSCAHMCHCLDKSIRHYGHVMNAIFNKKIVCIHDQDLTNNIKACTECNSRWGYHIENDKLLCKHNKEHCIDCANVDKHYNSVVICYDIVKGNTNLEPTIKVLLPIDINKLIEYRDTKFVERIIENGLEMKVVGVPKEQFDIVTNIGLDLIKFKPVSVYYYLKFYMNDIIINKFEQFKDHVVFEVKSKNIIDKLQLIEMFDPIYYKTLQKQLLLKKGITDDIKVLFKYAE